MLFFDLANDLIIHRDSQNLNKKVRHKLVYFVALIALLFWGGFFNANKLH